MKRICKECRELKEYHARGLCTQCYKKQWYAENRENREQVIRKWREDNPEKVREGKRKWYIKNQEKQKVASRERRKKNRKKARQYSREYYQENKERLMAYVKKWQQENPNKMREYRLRKCANGRVKRGIVSKLINENIFKYGIITCEKCKEECENNYHVDHIKPISKGGTSDYDNLQILCAKHNMEKHVKEIKYIQDAKEKQLFLREDKFGLDNG